MELFIDDRIRNRKVKFFNEFSINLRYDSIASSFAFNQYFNPDNIELKEMMCIGHYHIGRVYHNGELLVTGYILSETFKSSAKRHLSSIGGYSLPGFLEDCQIAPDYYPLQCDGLTLREIATQFIKPFGLTMIVHDAVSSLMDSPYEKTTAEAGETIKDYLTSLAAQKNIVITHNDRGHLVFTRANTRRSPIIHYGDGGVPIIDIDLTFSGQGMHSHIHVVKQPDSSGGNAGESLIQNPYVPFVYRPRVIVQTSGTDVDTDKVARTALGAELKNLKLTIVTDRWEIDGKVIKPNNIISVTHPEVYLYKKTNWFVEEVALRGDNKSTTATLTCCLPEVYNDDQVKYLFSGINLH